MKHSECPLTYALTIVGGKWKPIIISHLKKSPKRFGKLDVLIPTISRKVLSTQLSELVGHKMLNRISYPETPPRVEYHLTEKAKELVPIFESLAEWGFELVKSNRSED
jgi:DNA-binding HxlR family transcriptional regulator|tara:strand:- start:87 stop:410 length:324 start_codon:yes stop_codon:yes gene_type:complete